jgi:MFS family permease
MLLGPLGVLLTYVAMSMVWTYYGEIGESGGLSTQAIANALSVGAVAVVGVSLLVTAMGRRIPRPAAISASLIFTCSAVLMAFSVAKPWTFGLSVIVWTCGTGIFTPYTFAATAEIDPTGSSTALAGGLSGAGIAIGPLLAAPFVGSVGIASIRILAPVFLVAGFVVLLPLLRKRHSSLVPAR